MNNVQLRLNNNEGAFYIMEGAEQIAKMEVGIKENILTVYHTEVAEKAEGKGLAKALLAAMAEHARINKLKVVALCPYVHFQFQKHPEQYSDVWQKNEFAK